MAKDKIEASLKQQELFPMQSKTLGTVKSSNLYLSKRATSNFTTSQLDEAGKSLASDIKNDDALEIINAWRSSHSFPLQIIKMMLKSRAKRADKKKPIVSQRLKRMASIKSKLSRERSMRLSQMQDVGGCRAIVSDIATVYRLVKAFSKGRKKNPKGRHEYGDPKDYIASPKKDGYRSIHYVVRYRSKARKRSIYNGYKIEIQIRSQLQHA